MANKLVFAPIDAKECSIVGLRTLNEKDFVCTPQHIENVRLLDKIRHEYLTELAALQEKLIAKYALLIKDDKGLSSKDEDSLSQSELLERDSLRDGMDNTKDFWRLYYT